MVCSCDLNSRQIAGEKSAPQGEGIGKAVFAPFKYNLFPFPCFVQCLNVISVCVDSAGQCALYRRAWPGKKRKPPQGVGDGNNVFTSFDHKLFQFLRFAQQAGCSFSQIANVIATSFFEVGIRAGNKNQPLGTCPRAAKPRSQTSAVVCSKGLGCFPTSKNSGSRHRREPLFGAFVYTKALLAHE